MFALLLGSTLALGAGLLASASLSEGALLASRTAAQVTGWLLLASPLLALGRLERAFAQVTAAGIAFVTGAAILYVAYFEWTFESPLPMASTLDVAPAFVGLPVAAPVAGKAQSADLDVHAAASGRTASKKHAPALVSATATPTPAPTLATVPAVRQPPRVIPESLPY